MVSEMPCNAFLPLLKVLLSELISIAFSMSAPLCYITNLRGQCVFFVSNPVIVVWGLADGPLSSAAQFTLCIGAMHESTH
jgi:hypothetical protein